MSKTKTKSFVNQFVALIAGDNNEVLAEKVWRQANSALSSQIPALEGDLVSLEDKVEAAKENLEKARLNNGELLPEKREIYVINLLKAKNAVTMAEEALEEQKDKIAFLKEELANLSKEE
jgi:hypothetical protein